MPFEVRATAESHFSWLRTRMSLERTFMSWARTAVSMIGFGFTIFQFFERLSTTPGVAPAARPQTPRYLALGLIGAGTLILLIALRDYHRAITYLRSEAFQPLLGPELRYHSPLPWVALLLAAIGFVAFVTVVLRVS